MRVGQFVDQLYALLASGKINRETEVVLIMPNGPEAVWWMIKGEHDGPLALIAMMLVKALLKDPRAFHCWLAGVGVHVGLDGHTLELRLRSRSIPRMVEDHPESSQLQLPFGNPEAPTSGRPQLSSGQGIVDR